MATLYTQQTKNINKTWLLMGGFFAIVIVIGFFFSQYYRNPSILYIFVVFSIVMNVVSYWYLWNIVENLSITAGLPMPKVCIIEDSAPNAFATGRDKNHAVVAVTTGILQILNKNEIEGVVAHELSHIGNRDILLSTVVVVLVGFISIITDVFLRSTLFGFGRSRDNDREGGGVMVLVGILISILSDL